jgi:hypothetical protein
MTDLKDTAAKVTDAAEGAAEDATRMANEALERSNVRKVIRTLKEHPLGVVALFGAGAAFVEVELAIGILTGLGATALLATSSGAQMRQDVMTKSKWALERARSLTRRAKSEAGDAAAKVADAAAPPC